MRRPAAWAILQRLLQKGLAIFDRDDTLVDGDSSHLWLRYQMANGLAPANMLAHEAELLRAYYIGELAIEDYMDYKLAPLRGLPPRSVGADR